MLPISEATLARLQRDRGRLATLAVRQMEAELTWFPGLDPAARSWIGVLVQAGIAAFVRWLREPGTGQGATPGVFAEAPREMARHVTLQQTLEAVRVAVDVVESRIDEMTVAGERHALAEATLRYSREVAFSAALVYARAAEERGAWDARLESQVVDAVVRGEADELLLSRASALGWQGAGPVVVVVGAAPDGDGEPMHKLRRLARQDRLDVLAGVQGQRLVCVLGGADPRALAEVVTPAFGRGPVVTGPPVPGLADAPRSAAVALAGLRAARAWPDAPRPVAADQLLVERLLDGDDTARACLLDLFTVLDAAGPDVLGTLACYAETGGSVQAAASRLYVHANTVRYRLRRAAQASGWDATDPRQRRVLEAAITTGRLAASS